MRSSLLAMAALLAFTGCKFTTHAPSSINQQAALTGKLPYNPLGWRVVTSWTNERQATMSTLFGNDLAIQNLRSGSDRPYPVGAVLALVTWSQRDDPHWFGAKIPSAPQSVEFVTMTARQVPSYERYQGSPLQREDKIAPDVSAKRIDYLLSQRAAVMP